MTEFERAAELAALPWAGLPERPMVLIPLGSMEQHGPHLPLDTDTAIASAVAHGTATRLRRRLPRAHVLVAPPIVYAASGEHQSFPGTMSIGTEALRFVLVELVRSVALWSGRIVFVNAHGGNLRCLSSAVGQLIEEGRDVAWVPCEPEDGDAHAGHTETSLMLHLAPDRVDMTRAEKGNTAPIRELLSSILAGGVAAVSPSGVLGDPTTATASEGARLLAALVADVAGRIEYGRTDAGGQLLPAGVRA
jgi:mycofactocin precursor peptide peptidase